MADRIALEAPLDEVFGPVIRLIVGGIAERADFGFDALDDLQLAIERLLAEAGPEGRVSMTFDLIPGRIRVRIGPLREEGLVRALQQPDLRPGRLTLGLILDTVVDSFGVDDATGGEIVVRLEKLVVAPVVNQAKVDAKARSRAEDRELLRLYHEQGDTGARERLVQRHLPLVRSLARRYAGRGEPLEDIEQVGAIGLLKAIDRFELERDVSLATYATPNVVGEIKRHFRDKGWAIRVPRALQELNARMSSTIDRLTSKLGHSPSVGEIAAALETTPEEVLEALEVGSAYTTLSLSASPGGEDGDSDPLDAIGEEDLGFERSEDRVALAPALGSLAPREREILRMRFEEGLPQTQIAERVGLSQMHVSRLIRKSLAVMRDELQ